MYVLISSPFVIPLNRSSILVLVFRTLCASNAPGTSRVSFRYEKMTSAAMLPVTGRTTPREADRRRGHQLLEVDAEEECKGWVGGGFCGRGTGGWDIVGGGGEKSESGG